MDQFSYQIGVGEDEERLDKWLSAAVPTLSRTYIQKCIKEGQAFVNGKPCKANYRLRVDDEVAFQIPEAVEPSVEAENIPLSVLYEDEDVLVVDKPKGMVVHPAPGHY
ncbi:MAG: RNA pseudouridine synthase, partial [Lachnospiraceae bacterium]|nr:RNA pseudouridine synthase [Lachnospiraceae bacterium]